MLIVALLLPLVSGAVSVSATPDLAQVPSGSGPDGYFLQLIAGKEPATDSASAATAMSTAHKTDDGNIAWLPGDPPGGALTTIGERLRDNLGFSLGVVSTVPFSHATPASFASHNVTRNDYRGIAHEMIVTTTYDVVIGGGIAPLDKYLSSADWAALAGGSTAYTHVVSRTAGVDGGDALLAEAAAVDLGAGDKLFGLFGTAGGNFEYYQAADAPGAPDVSQVSIEDPTLTDAVTATLGVLAQDPDGFFVMFEQGDIDWSNHANNFQTLIGGVWDLDQAVRAAEAYVDQPGGPEWDDTLMILTSDHSNSYMHLPKPLGAGDLPAQVDVGGVQTYPGGEVTYRTTNHTNELVTLRARGRGAYLFDLYARAWYPGTNVVDNTDVYQVMRHPAEEMGARHVILFIGDGMNVEHEIAGSRYLYGEDMGLAWHGWRNLDDGWGGYTSTWDVTTYNKYAGLAGQPAYDPTTFDLSMGYNPGQGGEAPYVLQPTFASLEAGPASLYVELDPGAATTETIVVARNGSVNVPWSLVEAPTAGDTNLYTFGGRSFSIWNGATGALVYDSGADLERSGGGVMVYDVTEPQAPAFVEYVPQAAGDVSPEGLEFVPAGDSPTHKALLVLAHELCGSTSVYEIRSAGAANYTLYLPVMMHNDTGR